MNKGAENEVKVKKTPSKYRIYGPLFWAHKVEKISTFLCSATTICTLYLHILLIEKSCRSLNHKYS